MHVSKLVAKLYSAVFIKAALFYQASCVLLAELVGEGGKIFLYVNMSHLLLKRKKIRQCEPSRVSSGTRTAFAATAVEFFFASNTQKHVL